MKKTFFQAICLAVLLVILAACGSSTNKEDMQKDLKEEAQKKLQKDAPTDTHDGETPSTDGPSAIMSVADAKKFIAAADANKGKLITVSGYPRGTTKSVDGEFKLFVSDKTGTGLPEENFACTFKEEMKEAVRTKKAGSLVKVTGNIAWNNGMVVLKNAVLAE